MAGDLLRKSWLWLYCLLCTSVYWLSKVAMSTGVRLRRRVLKLREKKALLKMGKRIQELHQSGQNDWAGDSKVKEILQVLEDASRKREELKSRLRKREDRFKEKVQKLREKGSSQPKGTESEAEKNE